jgi:hypothetical protein
MKDQILKIAKVKSEKEFYKKYPSEEAFMKAHGKAFKKAAMGAKMVNTQLHQLTDFGNPPQAQVGAYIGGKADHPFNPISFNDLLTNTKAVNAGLTKEELEKQETLNRLDGTKGGPTYKGVSSDLSGIIDVLGSKSASTTKNVPSAANNYAGLGVDDDIPVQKNGGRKLKKGQNGLDTFGIGKMLGTAFQNQGGLGTGLANIIKPGLGTNIMNVGAEGALGAQGAGAMAGAEAAGLGIVNAVPQILQGAGQIEQQHANIAKANQFSKISNLTASALESAPDRAKRRYVRPEDALVQPGQLGSPQGVGTNYLSAQNGRSIGGNPTEIQNTYAPGNLYGDLGYEPLNDSNPKQYAYGGNIPTAEFGEYFQDSGQASIGKGIGSAVGTAFFGPVGGAVGGFLGGVAGNLFGGVDDARKLQHYQDLGRINTQRAAWAQGANAIHAQNANVMKDGGYTDDDHGWVSNGWNPQVITHFGDLNVSQVHNFAHQGMDTLRAGGHLKEYTPPSAEAMYTGRDQYAMGGDLQTHWGGKAETLSHNPYLPDGGETVMFRGQSHDETDGKGRSGIGVTYGDNPVEVERGEPAVKLQDGGNAGDDNLVVFGNMMIPNYGVSEIGDKKASGKKFKNYVADLSKKEAKHNKTIEKATDIVNNANGTDPFDQLSLNAGKAMIMGANLKLKDIADKKQKAAMVQNAILDTAAEFGVESDGLAKGKLRPIKDPSIGKDGKKLKKAQVGWHPEWNDAQGTTTPPYQGIPMLTAINADPSFEVPRLGIGQPRTTIPYDPMYPGEIIKADQPKLPSAPTSIDPAVLNRSLAALKKLKPTKDKGKGFGWEDATQSLLSAYPFFRPTNQLPLDPSQLMGEMYALGSNQLEGVKAQTYQPMLDQPYDISLQDQLNSIDSQARAAILAAGQDPSAQSVIMAQAADAKNKVLGEQFRANQVNKAAVYQANRQAINQAQLQNLGILDNQYVRQETAKSKTKAETFAALESISDKIAKNKLENRTLGITENMYNYRFDPQGRAYNINNPAQFAIPSVGISDPDLTDNGAPAGTVPVIGANGQVTAYKVIKPTTTKKRNGSIVKAIKNL